MAVPVEASTELGNALGVALMAIAAVLLVALVLAPPLLARASANRRARRNGLEDAS